MSTETLAIHVSLPFLLVVALAYAAEALRRLADERTAHERLAIEAERKRIAFELHDSAKQRLHAAHLLVTSLLGRVPEPLEQTVARAAVELESAASDMDTSLAELRSPLEGRRLDEALRARVDELARDGGPRIDVHGEAPDLSALVGAHAYRIASEALTNALRHADATGIDITFSRPPGLLRVSVRDDGRGLPEQGRAGSHRPVGDGEPGGHDRRPPHRHLGQCDRYADRTGHPVYPPRRNTMIRIVVVDDHPALRAGLQTVLESEPGIVYAGESNGDEESLWPLLRRVEPDLMLLDYHLPKGDGLQLCYRIKQHIPSPKVVIFSAYASPELMLPATLARADGLMNKGVAARELFENLRRINKGERLIGEPSAAVLRETLARIPEEDRALTGMLLDGASEAEVARTCGLAVKDVRHVVHRTLSTLRHSAPVSG